MVTIVLSPAVPRRYSDDDCIFWKYSSQCWIILAAVFLFSGLNFHLLRRQEKSATRLCSQLSSAHLVAGIGMALSKKRWNALLGTSRSSSHFAAQHWRLELMLLNNAVVLWCFWPAHEHDKADLERGFLALYHSRWRPHTFGYCCCCNVLLGMEQLHVINNCNHFRSVRAVETWYSIFSTVEVCVSERWVRETTTENTLHSPFSTW